MTVSEMKMGDAASVSRIERTADKSAIRQRLLDMGIVPKAKLQVRRVGPTGDPIWVEANGVHVALRRAEASLVIVK